MLGTYLLELEFHSLGFAQWIVVRLRLRQLSSLQDLMRGDLELGTPRGEEKNSIPFAVSSGPASGEGGGL